MAKNVWCCLRNNAYFRFFSRKFFLLHIENKNCFDEVDSIILDLTTILQHRTVMESTNIWIYGFMLRLYILFFLVEIAVNFSNKCTLHKNQTFLQVSRKRSKLHTTLFDFHHFQTLKFPSLHPLVKQSRM